MTAPPLPTFVPQDAWYNLTVGNVTPSVADPVPDITFLQPYDTPLGEVDGLIGPFDGATVILAGLVSELDGGQKWLMWDAASLTVDDGVNVFCPYANSATPGRWFNIGAPTQGAGVVIATQFIVAGTADTVTAARAPLVQVFVKTRVDPGETTVALPGATFTGQTISVKDAQGDAGTYNVVVTAPSIDGQTEFRFYANYQSQNFMWNGTEWSAT